jgi:hypothetical protein
MSALSHISGSGSHTSLPGGYFPLPANRKMAGSAPNKMPLNWPSLKAPANSNCSPASRCEEKQATFVTRQPTEWVESSEWL